MFRGELAQLEIISYMCRDKILCHLCAANVWKTEMQLCCTGQVLNDNREHKAVLSVVQLRN